MIGQKTKIKSKKPAWVPAYSLNDNRSHSSNKNKSKSKKHSNQRGKTQDYQSRKKKIVNINNLINFSMPFRLETNIPLTREEKVKEEFKDFKGKIGFTLLSNNLT